MTKPITDTTGYPPRPSDACMQILTGRHADPAARAEFDAAYRAEILAAGYDPDFNHHHRQTAHRGQGKNYALPRGDRD